MVGASLARISNSHFKQRLPSLRAKRSNPSRRKVRMDCFGRSAPRNDGWTHLLVLAAHCARVVKKSLALERRGRREDRVRAAPAVSCAICTRRCAHEHTGSAGASRPSLRNGFTAYIALSPVNGLSCHRHLQISRSIPFGSMRNHKLDTRVAVSGPRVFAVRSRAVRRRHCQRPSHPTARFVTIASRPSCRVRRADSNH